MTVRYPDGYKQGFVTLAEMQAKHGPRMHPEFRRRFFRYIEAKAGLLGVGGGFRTTQPVKPGFAPPGQSFHEAQSFRSGVVAYCAVDLVCPNPGGNHRPPTWAECADAPSYLLHTFIAGEPWHIQPLEIRGWQTWVNAGRPDPTPPHLGDTDMQPRYIMTPTDPAAEPASPWLFVEGPHVRYATGKDFEPAPGYDVPPVWNVPAERRHEYDIMRKSVGI